jgi:hypothetical protein
MQKINDGLIYQFLSKISYTGFIRVYKIQKLSGKNKLFMAKQATASNIMQNNYSFFEDCIQRQKTIFKRKEATL